MTANNEYPTRRYPYSRGWSDDRLGNDPGMPAAFSVADGNSTAEGTSDPDTDEPDLPANVLHRRIVGIDPRTPVPLSDAELAGLRDPFADLLRSGPFPLTGRTVISRLSAKPDLTRESYVVSDGGHIPFEAAPSLRRTTRLTVLWHGDRRTQVLLSTGTNLDSYTLFLQVVGWDDDAAMLNFYERVRGTWSWAGNSDHSLRPPTRGAGPFDSHVNGMLVMKELRPPWLHWLSQAATTLPGLPADHALRAEPVFADAIGAEKLEKRVVSTNRRIAKRRVDEVRLAGTIDEPELLMRHVLESTTANLVSSPEESMSPSAIVRVPVTFLFDLASLGNRLGIPVSLPAPVGIDRTSYEQVVKNHKYELRDAAGTLGHAGEGHFALPVPERSIEDELMVAELVTGATPILGPRIAACLMMVDFPNPVSSERRQALMQHVPNRAAIDGGSSSLGEAIRGAILAAAPSTPDGSPEREFADLDGVVDWRPEFARRLDDFMLAVAARLARPGGVEAFMRLAESRRRRFRRRQLHEFSLTTPVATALPNLPDLRMEPDGSVH